MRTPFPHSAGSHPSDLSCEVSNGSILASSSLHVSVSKLSPKMLTMALPLVCIGVLPLAYECMCEWVHANLYLRGQKSGKATYKQKIFTFKLSIQGDSRFQISLNLSNGDKNYETFTEEQAREF